MEYPKPGDPGLFGAAWILRITTTTMLKHLRRLLGRPDRAKPGAADAVRAEIDALLQQPAVKPSRPPAARHPEPTPPARVPGLPDASPAPRLASPDKPDPQLDAPQQTGFDPYNTGAFDRSRSWETISKNRSR